MAVIVRTLPGNYCISVTEFFSKTVCRHIGFMKQLSYWNLRHQTLFCPHFGHWIVQNLVQWTTHCGRWWKKRSTIIESKTIGRVAWVHCFCVERTWPASECHGSRAVANSSPRLHQRERQILWTQPALIDSINIHMLCVCSFESLS